MIDYDPTIVFAVCLPTEYSQGRARLLVIANSSVLPTSVIDAVKELDSALDKDAIILIEVLSYAMTTNQDYFLRYDDPNSPHYHAVDLLYLNRLIQLRPKADKIRDAIRRFLEVK